MLGYTYEQLLEHMQSFPKWEEIRKGAWHIDHVFPVKAFVDFGVFDVQLMNSLENLRPLPATQNWSKSGKYDRDEFLIWLRNKGVYLG